MPMTSLASQLKKLETPQTSLLVHRKHKPSFLFDSKAAARLDRHAIYDIGLSGLEELKTLNPHFSTFDSTLFDPTSKTVERAVETSEANEKLNFHIKNFLTLLSPYFLGTAAHRALEWLINRFHIQDFNTDDVMFLILPYHETLLFAKMLQILPIREESGKWHWLFSVKKEGVPLSKGALLNRASKDMGFLRFICDMPAQAIKISGSKSTSLGTLFAFYCTSVIGALEYADVITENHISALLPSLLAALGSSLPDFTASGFMIIARLATKASLGDKILEGLLNKISKVDHSKLRSETTLVLVLLCQNVQKRIVFPEKGLRRLADSKWFLPSLITHSKNKVLAVPLICAILRSSLQLIIHGDEELKAFVQSLLSDLHIDSADAKLIFKCLLEEFDKEACEESLVVWYSGLFRDLEKSFPKVFDDTVSIALGDRTSKEAAAVETLLGVNTSRNDIYERLVHPNENVRVDTIKKISSNFEPEQLGWLRQPLLERLKDDSMLVVNTLMSMPSSILDSLPADSFVNNVLIAVSKFGSEWVVLKKAVPLLLQRAEEYEAPQVFITLLPYIFRIGESLRIEDIKGIPSYFSFFTEASRETSDRQKLIWDLLNDGKLLPKFDSIYRTFKGLSFLNQKKRFWASTALLLGFSIPDLPDENIVKSVMDFLISYLNHPKVDVKEKAEQLMSSNLFDHIESCKKMGIDKALHCLTVLTLKSVGQNVSDKSKRWDFTCPLNSFMLSIYKVIHEGISSSNTNVQKLFGRTKEQFLKNFFSNDEARINFLLNSLIFDSTLGNRNVLEVNKIIANSTIVSAILNFDSLVIPAAFVLLGSPDKPVRAAVLDFFVSISRSSTAGFYRTLVDIVLEHSDELEIDPEQIVVVTYSEFSPSKDVQKMHSALKKKAVKLTVDRIFDIILAQDTPTYLKTKLLEIFEFVQSEELFLRTCPLAMELMEKSNDLSEDKAKLLTYALKRFNETSIGVLKSAQEAWVFLDRTLSDQTTRILVDGQKQGTPCSTLINQVSKELFDQMPEPKTANQQRFLSLVIKWVTDAENAQAVTTASSMFKRIVLDSTIAVSLLNPMLTVNVELAEDKRSPGLRTRRSMTTCPPLEVLETLEWKRGVCLLELLQSKKKITNVHLLLPALFNILKRCLQFEHQNAVEYPKQLLLTLILLCCEKLSDSNSASLTPENLQVDLVVDCVRQSQNPQTHHHALLALTYLAKIIPEQILHNIMAIFTFIGSSVLRQDDAYSFQIISQIIDTVVPVLIKIRPKKEHELSVCGVLRVFVAAFIDIPEHRRLPLLHKLMTTLNDGEHLWLFLALVFESHVTHPISSSNDIEIQESPGVIAIPKRLATSLELCSKYPPPIILNTSFKLLAHMNQLPQDKDDEKQLDPLTTSIFNVKDNTGKQLRHYKYTLLSFLSSLLSSSEFVLQMADQPDEVTDGLQDTFTSILNENLTYLKTVLQMVDATAQLPSAKFWKAILATTYEILDKINALLPTDLFLMVIKDLLNSEMEVIRRKAMELLGWRLQDPRRPVLQKTLFTLLGPFTAALDSIAEDPASSLTTQERQLTLQTALFTLKLIARQLASSYVTKFKQVLSKIVALITEGNVTNWAVLGSLTLCAGELLALLKSAAISVLPQFFPVLVDLFKSNHANADEGGELFLTSLITSVLKIVDALAQFLSPYLPQLLFRVCLLSAKYDVNPGHDTSKSALLVTKLKAIRQKLSSEVACRVLVPAVAASFDKFVKKNHHSAIPSLMSILSASFVSSADLTAELSSFFIKALQFRSDHPDLDLSEVDVVESSVIACILTLSLKLSEAGFRPLYNRFFEWANRGNQPERLITFYRLSLKLGESLKNLFNLFAGIFIANASELLSVTNLNAEPDGYFQGGQGTAKTSLLVDSILATLHVIFLHDSHNFVNKERFTCLMKPLVDQIENKLGGDEAWSKRCKELTTPCIAQMATSMSDDSLWKQLSHHILLKTRHKDHHIRLASVRTVCSLARKLGEDFMPLLPETVPFLAELLEDDVEEVEKETQQIINEMEEILGEPIQKYF